MNLLECVEKKSAALTVWDIGVLKIYCVLFGVVVGAFISDFVRENLWWFITPVILLGIGFGYRWFTAEAR